MNTRKTEVRKCLQQFGRVNNYLVVILHTIFVVTSRRSRSIMANIRCVKVRKEIVSSAGRMRLRTPRL